MDLVAGGAVVYIVHSLILVVFDDLSPAGRPILFFDLPQLLGNQVLDALGRLYGRFQAVDLLLQSGNLFGTLEDMLLVDIP